MQFAGRTHLPEQRMTPTNEQTDLFHKTISARQQHYVAKHLHDWEFLFQPLTNADNILVNGSIGI